MNNVELNKFILENVEKIYDEIVEIRREFHMNPELGDEEFETSKRIKKFLKNCNIEYEEIINTGIIADIYNGNGKIVVTRADMDALPIFEENNLNYKSKNIGKMHGCGHDAHMAIQLGVAKILSENRDKWKGMVRFLFQPAEETNGGAKRMIENGALIFDKYKEISNRKIDGFFALHMAPELEIGKIGIKYGKLHACSAQLKIVIRGISSHAALPHQGIDAIMIGGKVLEYLQLIVSRRIDPREEAVITIGSFRGGQTNNIVCDEVTMLGTIRTMSDKVREEVKEIIERDLPKYVESFGGKCSIEIRYGYPSVLNNDSMTKIVENNILDLFGEENLEIIKHPRMDVEDVAYFLNEIPGCFFRLGTRNERKNIIFDLHNPKFNIDEESLKYGILIQLKNIFSVLNNLY